MSADAALRQVNGRHFAVVGAMIPREWLMASQLYVCRACCICKNYPANRLQLCKVSVIYLTIYVVRDLFPAGPISVIFVFYASISCNCDFSSWIDFWFRLWIPPQIFWWIRIHKIKNCSVVTTTGRKMAKIRAPVDRVSVRARVRLGLVSNSVSSG